ncbi:peroxisomal dehydratase [Multifurca ochricompacta]|uniref:Peroxisomal dehydratase n=1 Tax=Multifurca ochricompacta TaxID=376703 RepID=A0AAD4LYH9_9AGAM|nr:peroxisomal dehydratase [Multifurca ochricompacta]
MTATVEQLEKLVGQEYASEPLTSQTQGWLEHPRPLTYAIGIGAKTSEKQFVYELDPSFAAFPTYPVSLFLKGADQDVVNFSERVEGNNTIKGLPNFDPRRVVHASQTIEILKPLPLVTGAGWRLKKRLASIRENNSGVIIENEFTLVDPNDTPYARLFSASFNLAGKITGKRFARSVTSPPQHESIPKNRSPDWVVREQTSPEQALIYRLSGDYNPLHVDPRVGADAGFGGVILHGLSTFGFAARAILNAVGGGQPSALRYFGGRFTAPVAPGDELETSAWAIKKNAVDSTTEVAFEVKNLRTGKVVFGGGFARVVKAERSRL